MLPHAPGADRAAGIAARLRGWARWVRWLRAIWALGMGMGMGTCIGTTGAMAAGVSAPPGTLELAALTWPELRARMDAGTRTVLVPIGGTEQSGPQIALGKHNARVQVLAGLIAQRLGDALVAPVVAYVPEGNIAPPTQHMRWPGTISIPVAAFEATLEGAARSLLAHGVCHVVFLGDHGGYRASLARAAEHVNHGRPVPAPGCGALALPEYYRASEADFAQSLKAQGYSPAEIGSHAGLADTALTLATAPALVRTDAATLAQGVNREGTSGDPRRATAALGRAGVEHIVEVSVAAIRASIAAGARADPGAGRPVSR